MQLEDFDFPLPEGLIATRPAVPRGSARLLVADVSPTMTRGWQTCLHGCGPVTGWC